MNISKTGTEDGLKDSPTAQKNDQKDLHVAGDHQENKDTSDSPTAESKDSSQSERLKGGTHPGDIHDSNELKEKLNCHDEVNDDKGFDDDLKHEIQVNDEDKDNSHTVQSDESQKNGDLKTGVEKTGVRDCKVFDQVQWHHFRTQFLELIEELRIRRSMDSENEEKIQQLMTERHKLENKCSDLNLKVAQLDSEHASKIDVLKKEHENKIKDFVEEKAKILSGIQTSEKELKLMKDEARALQIIKYTLEKKVREFEKKLLMQSEYSASSVKQVTEVEGKANNISKRTEYLTQQQKKIRQNVEEACKLNKKLMFVNEHNNCELRGLQEEVAKLQKELLEARIQVNMTSATREDMIHSLQLQLTHLQQENKVNEKKIEDQIKELDATKKDYKQTVESLSDAHRLLSRHIDNNNKLSIECAEYKRNLEDSRNECEQLKKRNDELDARLTVETDWHRQAIENCQNEEESLRARLKTLQDDHEELSKAHSELEQINTNWAKKNIEINMEVRDLKAELNKPKTDVSIQTFILTEEVYTQIEIITNCKDSQTLNMGINTDTQTYTSQEDVYVQTEINQEDMTVQTDVAETVDVCIQSDPPLQCDVQLQAFMYWPVDVQIQADMQDFCKPKNCAFDKLPEKGSNKNVDRMDIDNDISVIPDTQQNADQMSRQSPIESASIQLTNSQPINNQPCINQPSNSDPPSSQPIDSQGSSINHPINLPLSPSSQSVGQTVSSDSTIVPPCVQSGQGSSHSSPGTANLYLGTSSEIEMSPQSRFQAALKTLKTTNRRPHSSQDGDETDTTGTVKKTQPLSLKRKSSRRITQTNQGKSERYSFQFINFPENLSKSNQPQSAKGEKDTPCTSTTSILQDVSVPRRKRAKKVHFSENVNVEHIPYARYGASQQSQEGLVEELANLSDDGLFSEDEDSDTIELNNSQIEKIKDFLKSPVIKD